MTDRAISTITVSTINMDSIDENGIKESPVANNYQGSDKAELKRNLIAIQIIASALRWQLNDDPKSNDSTIAVAKGFNDE